MKAVLGKAAKAVAAIVSFAAAATTVAVNAPQVQQMYGDAVGTWWADLMRTVYDNSLPIGMVSAFALGCALTLMLAPLGRRREPTDVELREASREVFDGMTPWEREFVKALVEKGAVSTSRHSWKDDDTRRSFRLGKYTTWTVGGDLVRFEPTENAKTLHGHCKDLFALTSDDELARRAVYDPDRRKLPPTRIMGSVTHEFDWWWYSDDPETDRAAMMERDIAATRRRLEETGHL